VMTFLHRNR